MGNTAVTFDKDDGDVAAFFPKIEETSLPFPEQFLQTVCTLLSLIPRDGPSL